MACSAAKNVKLAGLLYFSFQEPQEPGSKCSCNHPAEMIWDLLCLGCGEDRKAMKGLSFFQAFRFEPAG